MQLEICVDDDLREGAMRTVEANGETILLTCYGGQYYGVGASCPHAGAPLVEGVLRNGIVTCPWHKAAFSVVTGERPEPPAVDDLPRYAVRKVDGRVLVGLVREPDQASSGAKPPDARCFAIIGSGAAGALAADLAVERLCRPRRSDRTGRTLAL